MSLQLLGLSGLVGPLIKYQQKRLFVIKTFETRTLKKQETIHESAPLTFRTSFSWWKIYSNKACKSQEWRTLKYNLSFKNNNIIYKIIGNYVYLVQAKSNSFKAKDENYFQNK